MPPRILTSLVESADDSNHDHGLDIAVAVERYMLKTALDARVGDPRTVDETHLFDEPFVALAPTQNTSTSCRHANYAFRTVSPRQSSVNAGIRCLTVWPRCRLARSLLSGTPPHSPHYLLYPYLFPGPRSLVYRPHAFATTSISVVSCSTHVDLVASPSCGRCSIRGPSFRVFGSVHLALPLSTLSILPLVSYRL